MLSARAEWNEAPSPHQPRQMCTRSIFEKFVSLLYRNTFLWFFLSIPWHARRGGEHKKILIRIFIHHDSLFLRRVFFFFFWGNVKMRLTFMVVFFTIYNAQSQRKRKFSCINQRATKKKEANTRRERKVLELADVGEMNLRWIARKVWWWKSINFSHIN